MCLAIPAKIVAITKDDPLGRSGLASFGGVKKTISLMLVPEADLGDYVLVHVGFAITKVNPNQAKITLKDLGIEDTSHEIS